MSSRWSDAEIVEAGCEQLLGAHAELDGSQIEKDTHSFNDSVNEPEPEAHISSVPPPPKLDKNEISKERTKLDENNGEIDKSAFLKTKLCKFHIVGKCQAGEACHFAHSTDELHALPEGLETRDANARKAVKKDDEKQSNKSCASLTSKYRTQLCMKLIKTGKCDEPNCTYAHSREELRSVPPKQQKGKMENSDSDTRSSRNSAPMPEVGLQGRPAIYAQESARFQKQHPFPHLQVKPPKFDVTAADLKKEKANRILFATWRLEKKQMANLIKKYDTDGDGFLNYADVIRYSKGEFGFDVSLEQVENMFKQIVPVNAPGVSAAEVPLLKNAISIARNDGLLASAAAELRTSKHHNQHLQVQQRQQLQLEHQAQQLERLQQQHQQQLQQQKKRGQHSHRQQQKKENEMQPEQLQQPWASQEPPQQHQTMLQVPCLAAQHVAVPGTVPYMPTMVVAVPVPHQMAVAVPPQGTCGMIPMPMMPMQGVSQQPMQPAAADLPGDATPPPAMMQHTWFSDMALDETSSHEGYDTDEEGFDSRYGPAAAPGRSARKSLP
eukprot:gnl/TRDRNA2_/TRDRNA2_177249_c0_seq3.p1 gnl/TRDRNA2_/TRDRNA2_177249_c0~~gnl/TRDRNA2_/TRDRNA2_177249_c0_seq3.p1  ORF type:complete len:552 (-),score=153.37 gnl/TRDRNA2_/TRDRNA2_177249_c0_seq3:101-1756(-)